MIRESGFFLDGDATTRRCSAPWRARRHQREMDLTQRRRIPRPTPLSGTAAALNLRCSHNFFHWMLEVLPRLSLLRAAGWEADWYLIDCLTPGQRLVLDALGVGADQVRQPHCRTTFVPETLLLPSLPGAPALRRMAADLVRSLGVNAQARSDLQLYISRRKARTRRLIREEALEAALAARGFEIHCLEDYPFAQQLELTSAARTIVAGHGAGLAHLAFAPPGANVVEIVPADRYNLGLYPELSRTLGHRHRLVLAERAGPRRLWRAETADVLAAIDELAARAATSRGAARAAA
jgi:capsular polysaccharide biosynthesis protein